MNPPLTNLPAQAPAGPTCLLHAPAPPCDPAEVEPLLAFLRRDEPVAAPLAFPRGTLLPDGRLDLCKQSIGPGGADAVCEALADNRQVRHLLLGTNHIGNQGARAVARLVQRSATLETVYLGCNHIDAEGLAPLLDAVSASPSVHALWIKRNPIGERGAALVAAALRRAPRLRTLDLVQTGLGERGAARVLAALGTGVAGSGEDGIGPLRQLLLSRGGAGQARSLVFGDRLPAVAAAHEEIGKSLG